MAYASRRVPEISDTLEDVDHAMEWGFAHQTGPFRTWDLLGVRETVDNMQSMDIEVAPWVEEMLHGRKRELLQDRERNRAPVQPRK